MAISPSYLVGTRNCKAPHQNANSSVMAMVEALARRMASAWTNGSPLTVEALLLEYPELNEQPQAVVRLIFEEFIQASDAGYHPSIDEFRLRFPQWSTQLDSLFQYQEWIEAEPPTPLWPEVGENLGTFRLLQELGRGTEGRVFLAMQTDLADRLVVLKISPAHSREHLTLARLQHTHIVPLYFAEKDRSRNLRILCMPYFGGVALNRILEGMAPHLPAKRTGKELLEAIDCLKPTYSIPTETQALTRAELARSPYIEAVCRIGATLAETLHHAHQRGLLHLDVKPSNVLMTDDGQAMLLDFHLARGPLHAGGLAPEWLGGTFGYMAPEHVMALEAVRGRGMLSTAVDGRADVYSLGVLLHEALSGIHPLPKQDIFSPLSLLNPGVSPGLEDIVRRCLAARPEDRYPSAHALGEDLRGHLEDRPLRHVKNRSPVERWKKWRRRRPHALRGLLLALLLLGALTTVAVLGITRWQDHRHKAEQALFESRELMIQKRYDDAVRRLLNGLDDSKALPGNGDLTHVLQQHLRLAQRARKAAEVHALAETLRLSYLYDSLPLRLTRVLAAGCSQAWDLRDLLLDRADAPLDLAVEADIGPDLLDIAACWADLRVRLATPATVKKARQEALSLLDEAEKRLGGSPVLYREKGSHARALGLHDVERMASENAERIVARTAWDHLALARSLLRDGEAEQALVELEQAGRLHPEDFWGAFHRGVCAHRLKRYEEAVYAFCACIALTPQSAESFLMRGKAFAALGKSDKALADFNRALDLKATLAEAVLERGLLHAGKRRFNQARSDWTLAQSLGIDADSKEMIELRYRLAAQDGLPFKGRR